MGRVKNAGFHNGLKLGVPTNPFFLRVHNMFEFQFEGRAMINIVANIFFVGEHLMNSGTVPRAPKVSEQSLRIQRLGDFRFAFSLANESLINPQHCFDFLIRPRN